MTDDAPPGTNVTAEVKVIEPGLVIERVFASALVVFKVKVALPFASLVPVTVAKVFPVPVLENVVPAWAGTGLLLASSNVTVTLDRVAPSAVIPVTPAMVEVAEAGTPGPTTMPVVKQAVVRPCVLSVALRNIVSALV